MTKLVTEANIPLVYVNLQPAEETLPKGVAHVGSEEIVAGKIQGEAIAKLLNDKGNVFIVMGELATQAAVLRTEGVEKVLAQHPEIKIVGKQTANWRQNEAIDLMNNWLAAGTKIDAVGVRMPPMNATSASLLSYGVCGVTRKGLVVMSTLAPIPTVS